MFTISKRIFAKFFSLSLVFLFLISCDNEPKADYEDPSANQIAIHKKASCSDYTSFRYFYTNQKREGFSGWEIAYLFSLGYTSDELGKMDYEQKRILLLPGITGVADDSSHYNKLSKDEQEKLEQQGITPEIFEGLFAIGFRNISWLSQEKIDFLLPLDTLREKLEPNSFQENVFFEGYPQLLVNRLSAEKVNNYLTIAEEKGLTTDQIQYLRNNGITYENMLTISKESLNNLLWGLPQNASKSEQLYSLGYTSEELDVLSNEEEGYIFPFEDLLSKLESDGFSWATINSIKRDSNGGIKCKTIIQIILSSKQNN